MKDDLLDPVYLQQYLRENNLPLFERFGQNFLVDPFVLEQIVKAIDPKPNMPIIEIGPGLGVLTLAMADAMTRGVIDENKGIENIFAVELDNRIVPLLKDRTKDYPQIKIINDDILRFSPKSLETTPYTLHPPYNVIGNIPYNITSKILQHVLSWKPQPTAITLLMDAEVAKRVTATPPNMSVLATSVQVFAEPKIIEPIILPEAFLPQPKVKSAVVKMEIRENPLVPEYLQKPFFSLVKGGFAQKRKTLQNSLRALWRCSGEEAAERLRSAKIDPERRPQTLSITEWLQILDTEKTTRK